MTASPNPVSFKRQVVHLLDQFLLGQISILQLKSAVVPMLQISTAKKSRKNYLEPFLIEIAGVEESALTRDYVYGLRETILGENVNEKDRMHVFKRTLRKLIERFYYDEVEESYFLALLYDLMFEFNAEVSREKEIRSFFDAIQKITPIEPDAAVRVDGKGEEPSEIWSLTMDFYESFYKSLWDE